MNWVQDDRGHMTSLSLSGLRDALRMGDLVRIRNRDIIIETIIVFKLCTKEGVWDKFCAYNIVRFTILPLIRLQAS